LPRTEDVEVAQADCFCTITGAEHVSVKLVDVLGNGVGRGSVADEILNLHGDFAVSVNRRARGVEQPLDSLVVDREQDVQKAVHVVGGGVNGIVDGVRYGNHRHFVKYIVRVLASQLANFQLANISFNEVESTIAFELLKVVPVPGGELIQADNPLLMAITVKFSAKSRSMRWEPRNPAPPVTAGVFFLTILLSPDAVVGETNLLHHFAVEEISTVKHNWDMH
jgi:hypothetical protein